MPGNAVASNAGPSIAVRLGAYARLVHPFPSLLNAIVVAAFACVAVRGWPGIERVVWLSTTMLCIQFSIGALNDWADRDLDARTKPSKPIPSRLVSPGMALVVAVLLAMTAAVLATWGGPAAWVLAMTGLGIGIAYDLGVKRTPYSALTYALALPLIPVWVWTALDVESAALFVVLPAGMLLGVSLQLANALPDAEGDAVAGVRGTLQVLGPERGRRLCWTSFALALLLCAVLAPVVHLRLMPFALSWVAAALLLGMAVASYQWRPSRRALQLGWSLLAPAAGLLAIGWLVSLPA
jgi:4-hydroxybenzoate polyprenyltransferase